MSTHNFIGFLGAAAPVLEIAPSNYLKGGKGALMYDSHSHLDPTSQDQGKAVDPVLPDQGGRLMASDPGHVIPTSKEDVRRRAYARFQQRGREDGRALDDWLAAESEVNP